MGKSVRAITLSLAVVLLAIVTMGTTYNIINSETANGQYDTDGDGLIEVSNLEQLNAIRYDLDGDGRPSDSGSDAYAIVFSGAVCNTSCNGYELARSLDFGDANSYASGTVNTAWSDRSGWLPIGLNENQFDAIFDGNGHTISNLYVKRTTESSNFSTVGLFGYSSGAIRDIGMMNVDVTGGYAVGGLAGVNAGTIRGSYVTGRVSGIKSVGGLAGVNEHDRSITASYATSEVSGEQYVGGLVGWNNGAITASYATGSVSGNFGIGGLVGQNGGTITASFATGSVSGNYTVGGLTGTNYDRGVILASYATGSVLGGYTVGGLAGRNSTAIIASYARGEVSGEEYVGGLLGSSGNNISGGGLLWDVQTSGQVSGVGSGNSWDIEGKTTAELRMPTGYTGPYRAWGIALDQPDGDPSTRNNDFWDFGSSSQYPVLKVDFDGDGVDTSQEFGDQRGEKSAVTSATTPTAEAVWVLEISSGANHVCARLNDGTVICRGDNTYGQASPPSGQFTTISSGDNHTCGLRSDGVMVCWGKLTFTYP